MEKKETKNEYQQPERVNLSFRNNLIGLIGFIVSLLSMAFFWVPFFSWFVSIVGIVLSALGLKKRPKGLAITGLILSILSIVLSLAIYFIILQRPIHEFPSSFTPMD